jgi:hypothetical protein
MLPREQEDEAMSAVISGLVGGAVAFGLVTLAERTQKAATSSLDGWKALRPGWLINGTIVGGTALAALMGHFLLSGGSSLPDAQTQNRFGVLLLSIFAAGTVYMAWTTYGRAVTWMGDELRVRPVFGSESVRRLSDVTAVKKSEFRGEYRLTFRDGSRVWISAYLHGANELLAKLPRRASRN